MEDINKIIKEELLRIFYFGAEGMTDNDCEVIESIVMSRNINGESLIGR